MVVSLFVLCLAVYKLRNVYRTFSVLNGNDARHAFRALFVSVLKNGVSFSFG